MNVRDKNYIRCFRGVEREIIFFYNISFFVTNNNQDQSDRDGDRMVAHVTAEQGFSSSISKSSNMLYRIFLDICTGQLFL